MCLRWRELSGVRYSADALQSARTTEQVRRLLKLVEASGGRLVAFLFPIIACEFEADAWQAAIDLTTDELVLSTCGAALAEGPAWFVERERSHIALGDGPALRRAVALARRAPRGEVLIEAGVSALRRRELFTAGSRFDVVDSRRVRAYRLDTRCPWRPHPAQALSRLKEVDWIGAPAPAELPVGVGALSVVRARRGSGGTRFLRDAIRARGEVRSFWIGPGPIGEPLGALRASFARALATEAVPPALTGEHGTLLEALLAGEGLDLDASVTLIAGWLGLEAHRFNHVLAVDDVEAIDGDTLDIVALVCSMLDVPVLARASDAFALPTALAGLPRAGELRVEPLTAPSASDFVSAVLGWQDDPKRAGRFARRAGFAPLAMTQVVCDAIESGELIYENGFAAREGDRVAGRGPTRDIDFWLERRFARLSPGAREVLAALTVLGGQAEQPELDAVLSELGRSESAPVLPELVAALWVERAGLRILTFTSSSQREALRALLGPGIASWHAAAAAVLERDASPIAVARAAVHRALAGQTDAARALAGRAAEVLQNAGLFGSHGTFQEFASSGAIAALDQRGLLGARREHTSSDAEISVEDDSLEADDGALDALIDQFELERDHDQVPYELEPEREETNRIVAAWRTGDLQRAEQYAQQMRRAVGDMVADRLVAMTQLAQGKLGEALRKLRACKVEADHGDAVEQCRAALALGIGLAAAGRSTEALLEGLEGLARARQVSDARGERACARFLSRLSRSVGDEYAAARWDLIGAS